MGSSGGTIITPIGGGVAPSVANALVQPYPPTILSLDQYARVMGISPAHFWSCVATSGINPAIFPADVCGKVWHKYSWQEADSVSRYDVATEIAKAEEEIADVIGFWPGPKWIVDERIQYPRPYDHELFGTGLDVRFMMKSVNTQWKKIIEIGNRAVEYLESPDTVGLGLVYSDEDSDGLYETATIAATTTETDANLLKVYFSGYEGLEDFEIREPRKKYISGGQVVFVFDSWLLVKPELHEVYPNENGVDAIDISGISNFVTQVDVYKEYVDPSDAPITFYWENNLVGTCATCGGSGCEACEDLSQDGCGRIRNALNGVIAPVPASYSVDNGWSAATTWTGYREPDYLIVSYRAGGMSDEYKGLRTRIPMPYPLQRAIAYLATSRLERPLCGCSNVEALSDHLRTDMTKSEGGGSFFTTTELVNNPFGSRYGEVMAWRYFSKLAKRRVSVAVI